MQLECAVLLEVLLLISSDMLPCPSTESGTNRSSRCVLVAIAEQLHS
jgi:hypothetical protein